MDLEAMNSKTKYKTLIDRFEAGDFDILIGTQMVSKGLDFERVKLVGVMDADSLIGYPDFRAEERTYAMLTQVSGRSGGKESGEKLSYSFRIRITGFTSGWRRGVFLIFMKL